jgi:outer membrane protein TolC
VKSEDQRATFDEAIRKLDRAMRVEMKAEIAVERARASRAQAQADFNKAQNDYRAHVLNHRS